LLVSILTAYWLPAVPAADDNGVGDAEGYWPQWRGPLGTGVAPHANPPVEWSERKNIRWKIALPGSGHSTPVIWGDRVFLTTAVPYGDAVKTKPGTAPGAHDNVPVTQRHRFAVLAVSRRDGKIIWQRTVHKELPHEDRHYTGSLASNSPVTDGEHLFAFFGSRGLYCLDLDGELLWKTDLGDMRVKHAHGEGSSPALHGETLIINWDHEGQSFVIAFDKRTGKQRWKVAREEVTSWATPIVVEHGGRPQVIISGTNRVRGYDLAGGNVIWECGRLSRNIVASPVAADGMVYAASSYDTQAMLAIRLDGAKGDITGTDNVVWTRSRGTPYVPSLLLYGESLYFLRHYQGVLSRVNAKTGEEQHGPFRLNGIRNVYASPVGAADRVYITDRDGTTLVISHDEAPRVLALNRLEDSFSASAAVVGSELFLRGQQYLYCIAEE
jgi:outer membrane protein assembly factor BamB